MKQTISCKKNVFDIEHLEFQYLENVPVLQDINLTIDHRPTAIIGQNGAGKTTLMRMIAGIMEPTEGKILYDGVPIETLQGEYRRIFGYLHRSLAFTRNSTCRIIWNIWRR